MKTLNPVRLLTLLHRYYYAGGLCPIKFSFKQTFKRSINKETTILVFYLVVRFMEIVNILQLVSYIAKAYYELHLTENLDVFGLAGMLLWIVSTMLIFLFDYFFCNIDFNFNYQTLVHLLTKIWGECKIDDTSFWELKRKVSFRLGLLCLHNFVIDYFNAINFSVILYGNVEADPSLLYLAVPWKSPIVDTIYWAFLTLYIFNMAYIWSHFFVFPCAIAYNIEAAVALLTTQLNTAESLNKVSEVVKTYQNLMYSNQHFIKRQLGQVLLIFYLVAGFQQFMEAFFIFQFMKAGAAWNEYQAILLDSFVRSDYHNIKFLNKYLNNLFY